MGYVFVLNLGSNKSRGKGEGTKGVWRERGGEERNEGSVVNRAFVMFLFVCIVLYSLTPGKPLTENSKKRKRPANRKLSEPLITWREERDLFWRYPFFILTLKPFRILKEQNVSSCVG